MRVVGKVRFSRITQLPSFNTSYNLSINKVLFSQNNLKVFFIYINEFNPKFYRNNKVGSVPSGNKSNSNRQVTYKYPLIDSIIPLD